MNEKVKSVLNSVLERFEIGDIPEAIAYSMFPFPEVPSAKWSLLNRTLMFLNCSMDARDIRQWNKVRRFVKKGSKAFYILVPYIKKVEDDGAEKQVLIGFGTKAVFRVEDTDGEPLEYENIELPRFPLIDRARGWGISIKAIPGNYRYYGLYSSERKEITLASESECVFLHELSHTAHDILKGGLRPGQDPIQEIVAELASHCLCRLVGKTGDKHLGNSFRYISRYADKINLSPLSACTKVLNEVEQVLNLILNGNGNGRQSIDKLVA
ncbi:MAG: antirestriction protein [Thermodesulfobacteriota bacterium]|nr:antirestriction protein [Thermodesulfobacteriota bacterium]